MYEILIVGGGPAGLTAAIYAARAGKHVAVLERGSTGGQIISAPLVENYPGIPSVSGTELARQMTEQACTFGAEIVYTEAVGLEKTPAGFRVLCMDGVREAKAVILATGASHRRLGLPGEELLTGCGVSYCALCDGAFYEGADVAAVGGGSNAIGMFHPFVDDASVRIIGVEAAGTGEPGCYNSAPINLGTPGVLHGQMTMLLQTKDGQIEPSHSVSAGLDYPGVGPEHAYLSAIGRVHYGLANDAEALDAFQTLCRTEGILPALESSHALAWVLRHHGELPAGGHVVVNLSGRGDKDMDIVEQHLHIS